LGLSQPDRQISASLLDFVQEEVGNLLVSCPAGEFDEPLLRLVEPARNESQPPVADQRMELDERLDRLTAKAQHRGRRPRNTRIGVRRLEQDREFSNARTGPDQLDDAALAPSFVNEFHLSVLDDVDGLRALALLEERGSGGVPAALGETAEGL